MWATPRPTRLLSRRLDSRRSATSAVLALWAAGAERDRFPASVGAGEALLACRHRRRALTLPSGSPHTAPAGRLAQPSDGIAEGQESGLNLASIESEGILVR